MTPIAQTEGAVFCRCVECGRDYTFSAWKALPDHGARPKGARARRCGACGAVFVCFPWLTERPEARYEGDAA